MQTRREALVLGIGNLLWADEGFGVRAVEALHAAYTFPAGVELVDGGTLGLLLLDYVTTSRRVLVFDAIDFGLPPGTLEVLRDDQVPACNRRKLSPHQTGFQDVLALAMLMGTQPECLAVIGMQPVELADFGGSLREAVRAQLPAAVALGAQELARWGFPGAPRMTAAPVERLNADPLALAPYESQRPSANDACRIGDARVLARMQSSNG